MEAQLQRGTRTFPGLVTSPSCGKLSAYAVGDLNGDGKPDLAGFTGRNLVAELGQGDGSFGAKWSYTLASGPNRMQDIALTDLDGDGKLDVVAADRTFVEVLLGVGDGTFRAPTDYPDAGDGIAVADLNGDGRPDLISTGNSTVAVWLNTGGGTFTPGPPGPALTPLSAIAGRYALATGDFDEDGHIDLLAFQIMFGSNSTSGISLLKGNGDGSFQPPTTVFGKASVRAFALADFNADGHTDLAFYGVSSSTPLLVLLGNGDGTFQPAIAHYVHPGVASLAAGDADGDGRMDLALGWIVDDTTAIDYGRGDGSLESPYSPTGVGATTDLLGLGDLDGDGRADLLMTRGSASSASLELYFSDAKGHPVFTAQVGLSGLATSLTLGDLDGDGLADLALAVGGHAEVWLHQGAGFATTSYTTANGVGSVAIADADGDGHLDLVLTDGQLGVTVLPGNGDGTFQAPVASAFSTALTNKTSIPERGVLDLNGDGLPDLVLRDVNGNNTLFAGLGGGAFATTPFAQLFSTASPSDLNNDGLPDFFGSPTTQLNAGGGAFTPLTWHAPEHAYFAQTSEFTGDGIADAASPGASTYYGVGLWTGLGDGSFQMSGHLSAASNPQNRVRWADFNGDGQPDLLTYGDPGAPMLIYLHR